MSCENCEESAYVIDKLAKLLAEIAVIVNGPEPPLTRWSYHDLPEKVQAMKQAPPAAIPADGMLPDALVPHAKEWYRLCERRFAVDRITISGKLAEAIVAALSTQAPPAAVPARLTPDRERVARAIFAAIVSEGGMKPHQFETLDGEVKKRLRALADAAIDAMGETP